MQLQETSGSVQNWRGVSRGARVACSHLSNAGCCWAVNVGRLPAKPQRLISVSTPVKHKDGTCQCGGFVQLFKVNFVSPGLSNKKQCNLLLFAVE